MYVISIFYFCINNDIMDTIQDAAEGVPHISLCSHAHQTMFGQSPNVEQLVHSYSVAS